MRIVQGITGKHFLTDRMVQLPKAISSGQISSIRKTAKMKWCSVRNVIIVDKEKLCLNTQKKKYSHRSRYRNYFYPLTGFPERLYKALMNSSTVLTVWDDAKLVGLTRVLDDTEMLAQIHYVLVRPDYQGKGIAGKMLEHIKEKYKDFFYIEAMPENRKNVPFYEKHGFSVMKNGAAIQICNRD